MDVLVVPQLVLLGAATWDHGRIIAYQIRHGGNLHDGSCIPIPIIFNLPYYTILVWGLFTTIYLLEFRSAARKHLPVVLTLLFMTGIFGMIPFLYEENQLFYGIGTPLYFLLAIFSNGLAHRAYGKYFIPLKQPNPNQATQRTAGSRSAMSERHRCRLWSSR